MYAEKFEHKIHSVYIVTHVIVKCNRLSLKVFRLLKGNAIFYEYCAVRLNAFTCDLSRPLK